MQGNQVRRGQGLLGNGILVIMLSVMGPSVQARRDTTEVHVLEPGNDVREVEHDASSV